MSQISKTAMARLVMLAAAQGQVYMTKEEGQELGANQLITVDGNTKDPNNEAAFAVAITEAGMKLATENADAGSTERVKPVVSDTSRVKTMPTVAPGGGKRERTSQYPFDKLEAPNDDGFDSFHVACTDDNPEPWKAMSSNVSAANRRSMVEVKDAAGNVVMETVKVRKMIKGEDGKALLKDGKRQYSESEVTQPKMQATKKFVARRVSGEGENADPAGDGCRVFRVELPAA